MPPVDDERSDFDDVYRDPPDEERPSRRDAGRVDEDAGQPDADATGEVRRPRTPPLDPPPEFDDSESAPPPRSSRSRSGGGRAGGGSSRSRGRSLAGWSLMRRTWDTPEFNNKLTKEQSSLSASLVRCWVGQRFVPLTINAANSAW